MYNPTVIDNNGKSERAYDIYSRLLKDRIIFVGTAIDETVANSIIAQLLYLEAEDPEKDIIMYINSPGGSVTDGMAIYDTMNYIKPDVQTVCVGQAASMGAFLLAAGAKGKRFALENSRIMIHQPLISGGLKGQATDISIHANELLKIKDTLIKDTLDKFKEKQDYYSFESFLTSILRLRTLNYLTAGEFYSLMKMGFEINKNIWRDIDYFFKSNSLDFSRFKNESTLLINFEVNSKEDAEAIIELFNLAVKLFFSKNNEVYFSSDNYLSKMVKSIGGTKWIPDDYDLGVGIPKSRLSMFVLRQRFAN